MNIQTPAATELLHVGRETRQSRGPSATALSCPAHAGGMSALDVSVSA
jgi:hypothetical protein